MNWFEKKKITPRKERPWNNAIRWFSKHIDNASERSDCLLIKCSDVISHFSSVLFLMVLAVFLSPTFSTVKQMNVPIVKITLLFLVLLVWLIFGDFVLMNMNIQILSKLSIHLLSSIVLSEVWLWRQQVQGGNPGTPFPSDTLQLLLGDRKVFRLGPEGVYNQPREFWVYPETSSHLDVSEKPPKGCDQVAS